MVILSPCVRSSKGETIIFTCIVGLSTSFFKPTFSMFNIAQVLPRTITKELASLDFERRKAI